MAAQIGVSRATIREVYARLAAEGHLQRRHGIGTFFRAVPIRDDQNIHVGFPEAIRQADMSPSCRLLSAGRVPPDPAWQAAFAEQPASEFCRAERLLLADNRPAVHIVDLVPADLLDSFDDWSADDVDMIAYLRRKGVFAEGVIQTDLNAAPAPAHVARHLAIAPQTPVLSAESTIQDQSGRVVVYAAATLRSDLIALKSMRIIAPAAQRPAQPRREP